MKSSLAAPYERDRQLTDEQVGYAMKTLVHQFPQLDRMYADPLYLDQVYCLVSFVPTQGAKPDEHGNFGFMKVRGSFRTAEEANARAEWIIRNCDSYHALQTAYVGKPFPVCVNTEQYSASVNKVNLKKQITETYSQDIRAKKDEERRVVKEINERKEKLIEETSEDFKMDPLDRYIELNVKRSQLVWTYKKYQQEMEKFKTAILKAREEIAAMDEQDASYRERYMDRYMSARREIGFPENDPNAEDNFIQYMELKDIDLGF